MPKAYFYMRVSTDEQTVDQQEDQLKAYYEQNLKGKYEIAEDSWYRDIGVSGSLPFRSRPAGQLVNAIMQPGDCLVVTKLDRAFRSTRDCCETAEEWVKAGIFFHMLWLHLDTSTAAGMFLLQIMSAVAQLERALIMERTKEKLDALRRRGLYAGGVRRGFRVERGKDGLKRVVPDPRARAVMAQVLAWAETGMTYERIYWHLKTHGVRKPNGKVYALSTLKEMGRDEARLQAEEKRRFEEELAAKIKPQSVMEEFSNGQ